MFQKAMVSMMLLGIAAPAASAQAGLRADAEKALRRAAEFYRNKVATHGGYVYYSTPDLSLRWGEGKADADTIFVQPPGTPTVGLAFLRAFEATGDAFHRDAAVSAAESLVYGQLASGGWTQTIHFGPAKRVGKYRNGKGGSWNASSLDDNQTQAALRLLIETDRALNFKHAAIHEAAMYGLDALLKAQFPIGAFPQVWTGPVAEHPIKNASFPGFDWKSEGRVKSYWDHYTLNDGLAGTVAEVLILARDTYRDEKYRKSLLKLGDFLIRAQMPEPQPGWCQQYNFDMVPIWARKFEPPAITGWESQDAMNTLIRIANISGDKKYLEAVPKSLAYFEKCLLPDGRVARYYEFKTNKPLYMNANYELTYDDAQAPAHYGWKQPARFAEIAKALAAARDGRPLESPKPTTKEREADVRRILKDLDSEGRWVSVYSGERLTGQPPFTSGFRYLSSDVFSRNVETLSAFLAAK